MFYALQKKTDDVSAPSVSQVALALAMRMIENPSMSIELTPGEISKIQEGAENLQALKKQVTEGREKMMRAVETLSAQRDQSSSTDRDSIAASVPQCREYVSVQGHIHPQFAPRK